MAFVVWTCNGNPRSWTASAYWESFSCRELAEQSRMHHCNHCDYCTFRDDDVTEDEMMPPGRNGSWDEYPRGREDYDVLLGLKVWSLELVLEMHRTFESQDQWGHVPHWLSATLAAYADGEDWEGELVQQLLAVAFGLKDAPVGEGRQKLFQASRLLGADDFRQGSRLNPMR